MNKILKIAAAALAAVFVSTAAQADDSLYGGAGVVIVPTSIAASEVDASAVFPNVKRGQIISYQSAKKRGSIVISTKKNELYLVLGYGKAVKYRVATARKGFEWTGTHTVVHCVTPSISCEGANSQLTRMIAAT